MHQCCLQQYQGRHHYQNLHTTAPFENVDLLFFIDDEMIS